MKRQAAFPHLEQKSEHHGYRLQFRLARRQLLDLLNIQAEAFSYQSAAKTAFYDEQVARARLLATTGNLAARFVAQ